MRRKMITVSAALALMLNVAGCKDKAPEETTAATTMATTTEAVNVTKEDTTAAPVTTAEVSTTAEAPVATTAVPNTEADTAPVTLQTTVPLTSKYFPDEAFRTYVTIFDKNQDSILDADEMNAVTEINAYPWTVTGAISDLKGIEWFSNLEVLNIPNNALTELNLDANEKIAHLNCPGNQLTTLDLSSNVALTSLDCHCNQLTSLDLRANQDLQRLNCVANSMSELNLSGLSNLKSVMCFCNPSLKITANNCSSSDESIYIVSFKLDATASISSNSNTDGRTVFRIEKRYDHAPTEDGSYYASLADDFGDFDDFTQLYYEYGFDYGCFTGATADQDTLTIQDARLTSNLYDYYYSYDCGTMSLPLAQTVKYLFYDCTYDSGDLETIEYKADDFNTFFSTMLKKYHGCFSEETSGELLLFIHILNGSIDEIQVSIYQYP